METITSGSSREIVVLCSICLKEGSPGNPIYLFECDICNENHDRKIIPICLECAKQLAV